MPRSPEGKLAVLAIPLALMGFICIRLIVLLAEARPYAGWYWLLAVAGGVVVAVTLPWAFTRRLRGSARWPAWLLVGYVAALGAGPRYYLTLRFTPPADVSGTRPSPPPLLVLNMAGLSAVTFTFTAITLLILAAMAEVIAPGPVGGWLQAQQARRALASRHPGPVDERFTVSLRREATGSPAGPWLRGEIHVRPGSLLWEPAKGVLAAYTELAASSIVTGNAGQGAKRRQTVIVDTPTGRVQLGCGAELFALLQRIAAELARTSREQAASAEAPGQPGGPR